MQRLNPMQCVSVTTLSIAFLSACGTPSSAPSEGSAAVDDGAETAVAVEALSDAPVLGLADSVVETFHDSDTMMCGSQKVHINGPIRAFEDQNNKIHLTVSDPSATGWQWTGSAGAFTANPKTAPLDCNPVMLGNSAVNNPAKFDQKTSIEAIYFRSSTVYAYGHEDYFGTRTSEIGCHEAGTADGLPLCWYASVALWTSPTTTEHLSFGRFANAPNHVAIYPHVQYPGHASTPTSGWIGYGTPSNIVRGRKPDGTLDGYYYMFVYASAELYADQHKGVCLFRSADPTNRSSWRAWNGDMSTPVFTQAMSNPYSYTNSDCKVVDQLSATSVQSVVWHKPSRHYIAIFRDSDAVLYASSPDLLTWSTPQNLLISTSAQASYPVIIDHDGGDYGDDNFDRLYSNGNSFLFYRKSIAPGHTRITRRRIEVINYPADFPGSSNPG